MTRNLSRSFAAVAALLVVGAPAAASGHTLHDAVVTVSYLNVKPEQTAAWLSVFKKHYTPALEQLKKDGALLGWHLFVPTLHHGNNTWTHALVLGHKDRAAQGVVEKRLMEVREALPAADAEIFTGALDREKHFDEELREINFEAVAAPAENKEEEKK